MAIEFSSTGQTVVTWTLTDSGESASRESAYRTARDISHGTGPNQATVAYSTRLTLDSAGVTLLDPGALIGNIYSITSNTAMTRVREMLVSVSSGPTGGWILFGGPTGPSGITGMQGVGVRVGGQLHWVDYQSGAIGYDNPGIGFKRGTTGTYTVDVTIVGLGEIGAYV